MNIFGLVALVIYFIDKFLVPLIFAIAFVVFLWGMVQYFIASGDNDEKRENGKKLAFWGIIAFAIMISIWGLTRLVVATFGFEGQSRPALPTFGSQKSESWIPESSAPVFGGSGNTKPAQSSSVGSVVRVGVGGRCDQANGVTYVCDGTSQCNQQTLKCEARTGTGVVVEACPTGVCSSGKSCINGYCVSE
jgi:hypothetical protein